MPISLQIIGLYTDVPVGYGQNIYLNKHRYSISVLVILSLDTLHISGLTASE